MRSNYVLHLLRQEALATEGDPAVSDERSPAIDILQEHQKAFPRTMVFKFSSG
jgi:hypothetical protein